MKEMISLKDSKQYLKMALLAKEDMEAYYLYKEVVVIDSNKHEINYEYVASNDIMIWNIGNTGGTIVECIGDIGIVVLKKQGWDIGKRFLMYLKSKISEKVENVEINGNDIIIDGKYKVASCASVNLGDNVIYTAIHLSYNPDIELIKNICTKSMIKIPKGLKEYGFTLNDLKNIVNGWETVINKNLEEVEE